MSTVLTCHKCKIFISVDESYEGQMGIFLFERDHPGHSVGNIYQAEVGSYTHMTHKYFLVAK